MSSIASQALEVLKIKTATRLVAHHHIMRPKAWVLSWDFGDGTSIGTEGKCSRKEFRLARDAVAYGLRTYHDKAVIKGNW